MTFGLWHSVAGLQTNAYRQTLAANNLANVETAGFKRDLALIYERPPETAQNPLQRAFTQPLFDGYSGGLGVHPTHTSFEQGDLLNTGNPLDLALDGPGFFNISDGTGQYYTRDGRMTTNVNGELVMVAGGGRFRLMDASGRPIRIDPELGPVKVGRNGDVTQQGGGEVIARISVLDFAAPSQLRKRGENLYQAPVGVAPLSAAGQVISGHIERSNVEPAEGLVGMIEVSRAYELNGRMISLQDQTLDQAVNRVGRIG